MTTFTDLLAADPSLDPQFRAALDWRAKRLVRIENAVIEMLKAATDENAGRGTGLQPQLDHLADLTGFDIEAYRETGFDREDV